MHLHWALAFGHVGSPVNFAMPLSSAVWVLLKAVLMHKTKETTETAEDGLAPHLPNSAVALQRCSTTKTTGRWSKQRVHVKISTTASTGSAWPLRRRRSRRWSYIRASSSLNAYGPESTGFRLCWVAGNDRISRGEHDGFMQAAMTCIEVIAANHQ
jgi:hypothetical protein